MKKNNSGLSLLEILVVITIFAVLGVIVTRSVLLTLQGSRKTEAIVKVRENVNFAMSIMERQIRNADNITTCPLTDPKVLTYTDSSGQSASFSCVNTGGTAGYIASGSARLTNDSVNVVNCQFSCSIGTSVNPPSVTIDVTASEKVTGTVPSSATVTASNQIYLRNY